MAAVLKGFARALLLTGAVAVVACGGGGGGGGGATTTSFTGVVSLSDGSASGSIFLLVETANPAPPAPTSPSLRNPVNVTGTLTIGNFTTQLTGTYDPDSHTLAVTGGGYTFGGTLVGNNLEGSWTGPNNTAGTFVSTVGANATAYCGTYNADDQSDSGTFSIVISGNQILGEAWSNQDQGNSTLVGTRSGNNITIDVNSGNGVATGTVTSNGISGTWSDQGGSTGTFAGSVCP